MTLTSAARHPGRPARRAVASYRRRDKYIRFALPALLVVAAVIVFPGSTPCT
jgi:hypothetical protein